jgi:hypothetical protein
VVQTLFNLDSGMGSWRWARLYMSLTIFPVVLTGSLQRHGELNEVERSLPLDGNTPDPPLGTRGGDRFARFNGRPFGRTPKSLS